MYDKYFEPIREKKLKVLEIGLGCDMVRLVQQVTSGACCVLTIPQHYGPGASYYTWLDYFPNVELYYIEADAACAEKWTDKTAAATVFSGDQADRAFLQRFVEESGGHFDIIIDDGGHSMNQQRTSFEELFGIVKPGALYCVEDLQTSYLPAYDGDSTGGKDPNVPTMMKYIYQLIDDKMADGDQHVFSKDIRGIDCMRQVCCIDKKEVGSPS